MIYTNTPGSASEQNKRKMPPRKPIKKLSFDEYYQKSKTPAGVLAGSDMQYRVSNSTWTPEQMKAFNAPVYKADRRVTKSVAGIPIQQAPQQSSTQPDLLKMALEKILAKKTYSAPGFEGKARAARIHSQKVQDQRRVTEQLKALAGLQMQEQGSNKRATIMANKAKAAAMLTGEYGLKRQAMTGENQQAIETMRQAGAAEGRQQTFSNQQALEKLREAFQAKQANAALQAGNERSNLDAAIRLLGMGVNPNVATNVAGTPQGMTPDLSGVTIPEKAVQPKSVFVKPQFDKNDQQLPGTGVWVTEPTGNVEQPAQGGNNYKGTMDLFMAKTAFNGAKTLADKKKYLMDLKVSNPDLYNALRAEVER